MKKVKRSRPLKFRRKGNEKQFKFNEEVAEKLESAEQELTNIATASDTPPRIVSALEKAKKSLQEGTSLLGERQKFIRLANRSEYGWELVNEYQSNELAENSDDEKKISKAEKAAEQKVQRKRKAAGGKAGKGKAIPRFWRVEIAVQ